MVLRFTTWFWVFTWPTLVIEIFCRQLCRFLTFSKIWNFSSREIIGFYVRIGIWEPNFGAENQPNLGVEWLVMAFWKIENQFEAQVISQYIGHIKLAITYENTIWPIWSDFSLWAISYGTSLLARGDSMILHLMCFL